MLWRTHFEVLGLEAQVLGLEAFKSSKMFCPRKSLVIANFKQNHFETHFKWHSMKALTGK